MSNYIDIRSGKMTKALVKKGLDIYRLMIGKKDYVKDNENVLTVNSDSLLSFMIKGAYKLKKLEKEKGKGVIHSHRHSGFLPAFFAKRFLGLKSKIIFDYHDPWSGEAILMEEPGFLQKLKIKFFHILERSLMKALDHLIVVSESQTKLLKNRYRFLSKITVVYNTVNRDDFKPSLRNKKHFGWSNRKVVMFSGCFVPYFGLDLLVKSASIVAKKIPNVLFIMKLAEEIKDKEYTSRIFKMIKDLNIEKNIKVEKKWFDWKEYASFIASADVGIILHEHTLLTETADPDKLHEYLTSGLPVIATHLKILKKWVKNGKNGLIVEHDERDIAEKIIRLLTNEKLRKKMGKASRVMSKNDTWDKEIEKLIKIYGDLVGN